MALILEIWIEKELKSLKNIILIFGISLATRKPLAPDPAIASTKETFFPGLSFTNVLYIYIEISLLNFAAGLKKTGDFEGSFSLSELEGTKNLVSLSETSDQFFLQ